MVSIDLGLRTKQVIFRRCAVLAAAAALAACGGGDNIDRPGSGIRGTLTITGSAASSAGGSFVVNETYNANKIQTTGPTCITLGTTLICSASWQLDAYEVVGTHVEQLALVLVSSSGSAPGPSPGSPPVNLLVGFGVIDGSTSTVFVARCDGPDRTACASVSDLGVTLDASARTATFVNVQAVDENDATRRVVLNGVIRY